MYIKDAYSISPQNTIDNGFDDGELLVHDSKVYNAIEPNYLEFVPASLLRRMGKAVRMGIGAGMPLLKRHEKMDGIIIGTANGGLENCINFLNQIVDYDEGRLTPTNFVQSTPNAVAGQLALMTENTNYNITHVNDSLSFENALLDGIMFLEKNTNPINLLIGSVEEISDYNYNIDLLAGRYKAEIVANNKLLETKTDGSVCGEGSSMFICSNNPDEAIAEILEVEQLTFPDKQDLEKRMDSVLSKNNLTRADVDCIILGNNGDVRHDHWYDFVQNEIFTSSTVRYFKNYVGEYRTATSFALYLATKFFQNKCFNLSNKKPTTREPKTVLIYNQCDGVRHGIILLKKQC